MKRAIEQWRNCNPAVMTYEQSDAAIFFALDDAKADILELYAENQRLREMVSNVSVRKTKPKRRYAHD